jgi:hypothetical protein
MSAAIGVLFLLVAAALATEGKSGVQPTLFALAIAVSLFGLWWLGVLLLIAMVIYHIFETA